MGVEGGVQKDFDGRMGVVVNDLCPLCHYLCSGLELGVGIGAEEWEELVDLECKWGWGGN